MSDQAKHAQPKRGRKAMLILLTIGIAIGILFWGGFNTAMEATNTETFCISCHEMEVNVYQEYTDTIHYTNRTGVRATCPDCHVPKDWTHKMVRKIQATKELYHHFKGSIDTPEKFEGERFRLAQNVWSQMKKTDSRECRNCHEFDSMDYTEQENRSSQSHQQAEDAGLTCIDCHKGIAHSLPMQYDPEQDAPGKSSFYSRLDDPHGQTISPQEQ
ncbi:Denitrification system component NirT [Lamprobacter modestohalophilus]|uniref:Cytochrome c-type protein n=1 Tax=Lamprobacter modestohalophilus TaxID=1064514 RepID=A0A9X0W999_9GAMM|nr:NapC/NirT family cytochrome c [Lamprobacter modestohalophilus]MBK1619330.1 Denitrification system component NirT [Lamprobacter modestohalophilus]MCF8004521.1 NapC/NirT family cytochrome c [Chromatiaceae bacterium]